MQAAYGPENWGEMVGVFLPLHPMEHQYLITDDLPEVFTPRSGTTPRHGPCWRELSAPRR